MAASVSVRSRSGSSPARSPQAFTRRRAQPGARLGTLPPIECSEPARTDALPRIDPFGARAPLGPGLPDVYRLDAVADQIDLRSAPVTVKILLENLLRNAGRGVVTADDVQTLVSWRPGVAAEAEIPFMPSRVLLQDFTGVPAVVDLAVMRDAMADLGGDPSRGQSARPRRSRHRSFRPGGPVRDAGRVRLQRRARVRPQRRALPAPPLGPDGVPRPPRRAARDGHRPPGQPRVHRDGHRRPRGRRGRPGRLPGYRRRDRLAHDHGQWPRRARLRSRRDRGGGRAPRPAALPADAPRRRGPPPRLAAAWLHGHRPRARRDRDAAGARRRREVRRVRRRRPRRSVARRPGHDQQHEPRVRGDLDALPDRRRDGRVPAADRPFARTTRARRNGMPASRGCGANRATAPTSTRRSSWTSASVEPSVAGPRRPQDRVPLVALRDNFRTNFPNGLEAHLADLGGEVPVPGNGVVEDASASSFPASDAPAFVVRRCGIGRRPAAGSDRRGRAACRSPGIPGDPARARRRAHDDPDRVCRDRRDHLVHEHVEPDGDGRGRPAGTERGGPRAPRRTGRQDVARARVACRDRVPRGGRAHGAARDARVRPGGLRLHDVHRQLGTARRGGRRGGRGERPRCRRGPVGQPQLRGPHPSAGAGQLPRVSAAGRRVRPCRPGRYRPHDRAARHRQRRRGRLPRRCVARPGRDPIGHRQLDRSGAVPADIRDGVRWRRPVARAADPGRRSVRLGDGLDLYREAAVLRRA